MAHREQAHQGLLVVERFVGSAVVLSAAGTIDMVTAPQFQHHVDTVVQRRPDALLIDLLRVEFMGSAGIGVLVNTYNTVGDDIAYAVIADGPATSRPLKLLAIDTFISVYPTVSDALQQLGIVSAETG